MYKKYSPQKVYVNDILSIMYVARTDLNLLNSLLSAAHCALITVMLHRLTGSTLVRHALLNPINSSLPDTCRHHRDTQAVLPGSVVVTKTHSFGSIISR